MNPTACVLELSAVADEGLFQTNPVWCLDRLVERWGKQDASWVNTPYRLARLVDALARLDIRLPRSALDRWTVQHGPIPISEDCEHSSPPRPGVAGLIVDVGCQETWLVPLVVERGSEWYVEPTLPFRPGGAIQGLFIRFLHALGLPHMDGVPERFAFAFKDPLGRRSEGPSMHIAGLLAIIREANGRPGELDRACAVVQPSGDDLVPVGSVRRKMDAFLRECGSGTLLVRSPACGEAAEYDRRFDAVWEVDSLASLAEKCEGRRWLEVFAAGQPLTATDARTVAARVRNLEGVEHRYGDALNLANRAERCGFGQDVPFRVRREVRQNVIDLSRHLGNYQRSLDLAEEARRLALASRASSHEDRRWRT